MKRRIRSAFMLDDDGEVSMTADQIVMQEGAEPEFSGLLDAKGNRLYRRRETVGFVIPRTKL
jgi:hypothetical protein